jgi:uncharacterized protein involved in exopolysaccharide biosynthesis
MPESFHLHQFAAELGSRWKLMAIACGAAAVLSVTATLLQPKQYTAVARLVIEPPAGGEARASMVVSPQYLESLKTYEHFVSADGLFRKALDQFGLRVLTPGRPMEAWKRRVLKVGLVRGTRVLEIGVTIEDPSKAQAMAQFLAEEAIRMSQALNREADNELIRVGEAQVTRIGQDYERAEARWSRLAESEPLEPLQSEVRALESQRSRILRRLLRAEVRAAEKSGKPGADVAAGVLETQRKRVEESLGKTTLLLARRTVQLAQADAQRKRLVEALETSRRQYEAARGSAGYRGERLRLVDPGIVPDRPSAPSLPLNLLAALLFAFALSTAYISLSFGYRLSRDHAAASVPHRVSDL